MIKTIFKIKMKLIIILHLGKKKKYLLMINKNMYILMRIIILKMEKLFSKMTKHFNTIFSQERKKNNKNPN